MKVFTGEKHSICIRSFYVTKQMSKLLQMQEDIPFMSGREAVQFFASCHHLGKIKSLFLNIAPNRHYRPYDLVTVPKTKVKRVIEAIFFKFLINS